MVTKKVANVDFSDMVFKAYATHDPELAVERYLEVTEEEPTAIIIRPDFKVTKEHPLLIRSIYAANGVIEVTHKITVDKLNRMAEIHEMRNAAGVSDDILAPNGHEELDDAENVGLITRKPSPPKAKKIPPATCPHCTQKVSQSLYNNLGFWHGWSRGKEPPYWQSLRLYVFRRDQYTCAICTGVYTASQLVAHHIEPKETGGTDSARNLTTVCRECHPDNKPLFV